MRISSVVISRAVVTEEAGWRRGSGRYGRKMAATVAQFQMQSATCLCGGFFFSPATVVPEYLLPIPEMAGISSEGELICSKQPSIFLQTAMCQPPLKAICFWPVSSGSRSGTERLGVACCFKKGGEGRGGHRHFNLIRPG